MRKHKKLKAYSMLQIMGAILIAGILTALAVPSIMKAVTKAKQGEATSQLEHIYSLERLYFMEFSKYSSDLEEIDFEQQKLVTEEGGARYKIEIVESGTTTFVGRATAVQDFDGDGVFNVWEINQDRTITETVKD
jgi:type IV pilus assembly protein PilE